MKSRTILTCSCVALFVAGSPAFAQEPADSMSFFITSEGSADGANLGGLDGADGHCAMLATDAGSGKAEWRAYLSTQARDGASAVNARDRIGDGPWFNARGVQVAADVADLHSDNNKLNKENSLTEYAETVNGRGDTPNMHDILTGSRKDGTAFDDDADHTCGNWTSSSGEGSAEVGHHDREGGGHDPTSWNSAHGSRGCGQSDLEATGGYGLFYCFARD
jgi:hypothetical protein